MIRRLEILAAVLVLGCLFVWVMSAGLNGPSSPGSVVFAAESLNIAGLPKEPRAYRVQVEQSLKRVDSLIERLKGKDDVKGLVLDLEQTRDNILREISKIETAPGDAKWTAQEMRDSVDAMLKLLKEQYDKAAGI